jgi:hypothetical protein
MNNNDRPICEQCNERPVERGGNGLHWRKKCSRCRKPNRDHSSEWLRRDVEPRSITEFKEKRYGKKKEICERCGFVPQDPCQLDYNHIDGNHDNDDPKNIEVICANCHRLVTKLQVAFGIVQIFGRAS